MRFCPIYNSIEHPKVGGFLVLMIVMFALLIGKLKFMNTQTLIKLIGHKGAKHLLLEMLYSPILIRIIPSKGQERHVYVIYG